MSALRTAEVPFFEHADFAGDAIDTAHFPHGHVLQGDTVPIVVEHIDGGSNGVLTSISALHGRSYVLELLPPDPEVWSDRYGNSFTAVSTKGNNCSKPDITPIRTAPSGFRYYGLQEGDALLRSTRASDVLRREGIDAEWPIRMVQPKLLAFGETLVDVDTYKSLLLEQKGREKFEPKKLLEISVALAGVEFYITYRAMLAAERAADLFLEDRQPNMPEIHKAVRLYNRLAPRRKELLESLELPEQLEPGAAEEYLGVILPTLIGYSFGEVHEKLGLVHGFPHTGNFNTQGGWADLDSVRGKMLGLGDPENRESDLARDFHTLVGGLSEVYPDRIIGNYTVDLLHVAQSSLLSQYLKRRRFDACDPAKRLELFHTVNQVFTAYELYGHGNRAGLLAGIIPGIDETIKAFTDPAENQITRTVPAKELAEDLYWRYIEADIGSVWERAGISSGLWGDDDFFSQSRLPTADELEQGLERYLGANPHHKRLFSDGILGVCVMPYLRHHGYFGDSTERQMAIPTHQLQELTCAILDIEPEHANLVDDKIIQKMRGVISEKVAIGFLPDYDEFWTELKQLFREKYLNTDALSIVPSQDLLRVTETELENYERYWYYHHNGLSTYFKEVPKDVVERHIAATDLVTKQVVTSSKEVLQIDYAHDACIRVMISDGSFNDYSEIFPDDETEDGSYLQFFHNESKDSGATYALFLIQEKDGTYRMEYNVLE